MTTLYSFTINPKMSMSMSMSMKQIAERTATRKGGSEAEVLCQTSSPLRCHFLRGDPPDLDCWVVPRPTVLERLEVAAHELEEVIQRHEVDG
eukprot:COSAG02_NODE_589_length_19902_cov_119.928939_14_plen_92_part_00